MFQNHGGLVHKLKPLGIPLIPYEFCRGTEVSKVDREREATLSRHTRREAPRQGAGSELTDQTIWHHCSIISGQHKALLLVWLSPKGMSHNGILTKARAEFCLRVEAPHGPHEPMPGD